jgi:thiamine-phosphate pyrophosphorylase
VRLPASPLLLVTDRSQARLPLEDAVARACAGGCRWVSVREKALPAQEQITLVRKLAPIAQRYGARLMVHGDVALARTASVDGMHLSATGDAAAARAMLGRGALVGTSIHSAAQAAALDPRVVDYAVAGPAFLTASKPGYGPALGADGLSAICRATGVPVIAIGGIEAEKIGEVIKAGVAGVAVMGSVMRSAEPEKTIKYLLDALAVKPLPAGSDRSLSAPRA